MEDKNLTKESLREMVNDEMLLNGTKQVVALALVDVVVDTMYDWPDFGPRDPYMLASKCMQAICNILRNTDV